MLRQWRNNNPELVRAQKRCYYERKVGPRVPRTQQRKEKDDEYDSDEILQDFFGVRVMLTDFKKLRDWAASPQAPVRILVDAINFIYLFIYLLIYIYM